MIVAYGPGFGSNLLPILASPRPLNGVLEIAELIVVVVIVIVPC